MHLKLPAIIQAFRLARVLCNLQLLKLLAIVDLKLLAIVDYSSNWIGTDVLIQPRAVFMYLFVILLVTFDRGKLVHFGILFLLLFFGDRVQG